ncbi:MAG: acyl--CoA ligase [Eubacterium sp.]|nr:acyl--CoA ligase [Eubacterium sp.]
MTKRERMKLNKAEERIASGEIIDQKSWKYLVELNSSTADQLDSIALIDGSRKYTYRQMFRNWEYYAEVFSALGMTREKGSRVGILAGIGAEPLLSFYALNMTGASVSMIPFFAALNEKMLENMIREEGITDLLVSDAITGIMGTVAPFPVFLKKFLEKKEELGLSNIIVLHVPVEGRFADKRLSVESRWIHEQLRDMPGIFLMEDLLCEYEASPIYYDSDTSGECSLIIHTSGTSDGIPKPVPFTDRQVNAAVNRFMHMEMTRELRGCAVSLQLIEMAGSYAIFDMVHLPLAYGGTVILLPQGLETPLLYKAIGEYRVNTLFISSLLIDKWMELPDYKAPDLSSLKLIAVGGSYLSADKKKTYNEWIRQRGARVRIINGYGLTETGAACILAPVDREDDAIGYPMPGVQVRIFDEEEEKFYKPEDGPRTGGLYIACDSLSSGRIGDKVYFEPTMIDGVPYYCTYDLVKVDQDGCLTAMGRMNRFFVNEKGVRFDSGLVEIAMTSRPGIRECGVVPAYKKQIHDTVPVLYLMTDSKGKESVRKVKEAICHVFITEELGSSMSLPDAVVITREIPYNAAGKVDSHEIAKGNVKGDRFKVIPIYRKDKLADIRLLPARDEGLPDFKDLIV